MVSKGIFQYLSTFTSMLFLLAIYSLIATRKIIELENIKENKSENSQITLNISTTMAITCHKSLCLLTNRCQFHLCYYHQMATSQAHVLDFVF